MTEASVEATAAAASANNERAAALMNQKGSPTPAEEQIEVAKEVATPTSDPRQFSAIQLATGEPQTLITQRHPVSQ